MRYGWSLQGGSWRRLPTGALKWGTVRLTLNDRNAVPNTPGVYAMCAAPPGHKRGGGRGFNLFKILYAPLYVGQARDLRARFIQHCKNPKLEIEQCLSCFKGRLDFWFLRLNLDQLDAFEAMLIDCFGPPANRISGITARVGKAVPA